MENRLHYIDWMRVLAFMVLIVFHCAMPFVQFNWEIKNRETSVILDRIIIWLHQWRLPLLFFIAGVGVRFSLKKRSVLKFLGERFIRLFIPLAFAMFFLTPLQVYFERLQDQEIQAGYFNFYPSVFDLVPYPEGTLTWSHMWFVAYLFVFTLLLLPFFSLSKLKVSEKFKQRFDLVFKNPLVSLSLAIPFIAYYFMFYVKWPEQGSLIDDWFVFNSSITFYFFGFLLSPISGFWESCLKYRRLYLTIACGMAILLILGYYWTVSLPKQQDLSLYAYGLLNGIHIWVIILSVIGYTMRYLNFTNTYLRYLTAAVYPYYILHQTVIVATGYYVVQWNVGIALKFIVLIGICVATIAMLYHFIIRKTIISRVLFGVKWNKKYHRDHAVY
ncbi:MAG: acyltransferase family protein [Bacteroidota bacterium]